MSTQSGFKITIEATDAAGNKVRTEVEPVGGAEKKAIIEEVIELRTTGEDSDAWLPEAKAKGFEYFRTNKDDSTEARRATFRQFYKKLFGELDVTNDAHSMPTLQEFQRLLAGFKPKEMKSTAIIEVTEQFQYRDANGQTKSARGATWADAFNTFFADRTAVNPDFSFAQYVMFWHMLFDQDDLRLLSPWFVKEDARPW